MKRNNTLAVKDSRTARGPSTPVDPFDPVASAELENLDAACEALSASMRVLFRSARRNQAVRRVFEEAFMALRHVDAIRRALRVKAGV